MNTTSRTQVALNYTLVIVCCAVAVYPLVGVVLASLYPSGAASSPTGFGLPPSFEWHTAVNPSETPVDAASVQTLLAVNRALGLPPQLGALGSWYDGATYSLEAATPALMYGPGSIQRAHTVGEWVAVDELVTCAQALAVAAWRLCR